ncbi:hypothetical protein BGX34_001000 [Mortierella sp. NVP85]|nr:hypothetical protein BGX34_001000 [Mortierella sp. NVP85]
MGSALSSFRSFFDFSQTPTKTLMIGLDAAGKTSILYYLKLGERVTTIPTIGFNVETVTYYNFTMTIWDVCGGGVIPNLWRHYFEQSTGLIFVVDSNDADRISEVRDHLMRAMNEDDLRGVPLLVLANKQDMPSSMTVADVRDALGLQTLRERKWHIQGTNALNGDGLEEGMDWFITQLTNNNTSRWSWVFS